MTSVVDGTSGSSLAGNSNVVGNLAVGGDLTVNGAISTASGGLTLSAGTTTVAPLDFTAGVNLTTPVAGAMEYDGKVIYATPQSTQRGVVPGAQYYRLDSTVVGGNVTTAQNILGVGVTLSANTVYEFEAAFMFIKTAGAGSHNFSIGFGGTATINNILYTGHRTYGNVASGTLSTGSVNGFGTNSAVAFAIDTSISSAAVTELVVFRGTVSVNTGGTFIPQYSLSSTPGGGYTTQPGSYMLIYPIGAAGANTSVGSWA